MGFEVTNKHLSRPAMDYFRNPRPVPMLSFQELYTDKALKLHYNRVEKVELPNGLTMEYALHGDDRAPEKVVLIMGLLGDKEAWLPLISALTAGKSASKYQFVTFDNRGVGGSDKPWGRYSTSQMAHDASLLMNHLHWKEAHIVGASMGGMIAQEFACAYPSRVKSLALLVTTFSVAYGPSPTWRQISGYWAIVRSLLLNSQHATASTMLYVLFPDKFLDEKIAATSKRAILYKHHIERQQRIVPSLSGMVGQYAAVALHYMSSDRLQAIKRNDFPILVMGAAQDRMLHPDHSKQLYRELHGPSTHLVFFEGSGHDVHVQEREEVATALFNHFQHAP